MHRAKAREVVLSDNGLSSFSKDERYFHHVYAKPTASFHVTFYLLHVNVHIFVRNAVSHFLINQ